MTTAAIKDALALAGLGSLGYGLWLHYPPLAFCTVGALVLAAVAIGQLRTR